MTPETMTRFLAGETPRLGTREMFAYASRVAHSAVGDPHLAGEIANAAIAKAFDRREEFRGQQVGQFLGWLRSIARTVAVDAIRAERRQRGRDTVAHSGIVADRASAFADADRALALNLRWDFVQRELMDWTQASGLGVVERDALRYGAWLGLATPAVADKLGVSHGEIRAAVKRGRRKLRAGLIAARLLDRDEPVVPEEIAAHDCPLGPLARILPTTEATEMMEGA